MSDFLPITTRRGYYRCPFCEHPSWKRRGSVFTHIENYHKHESEVRGLQNTVELRDGTIERLRKELAEARKTPPVAPPPKKEEKKQYYDAVIFCEQCSTVRKSGMPYGVETRNVVCNVCGLPKLHIVMNPPFGLM